MGEDNRLRPELDAIDLGEPLQLSVLEQYHHGVRQAHQFRARHWPTKAHVCLQQAWYGHQRRIIDAHPSWEFSSVEFQELAAFFESGTSSHSRVASQAVLPFS
jgi:hypothetical protein